MWLPGGPRSLTFRTVSACLSNFPSHTSPCTSCLGKLNLAPCHVYRCFCDFTVYAMQRTRSTVGTADADSSSSYGASYKPAHSCKHCQRIVLRRQNFEAEVCKIRLPHTPLEIRRAVRDGCEVIRLSFRDWAKMEHNSRSALMSKIWNGTRTRSTRKSPFAIKEMLFHNQT